MRHPKQLLLLAVAVLLIGRYYFWQSRITGGRFESATELNGFYNMLARGFLAGQLHLPMEPPPEMLRLPNPWDPAQNEHLRLHDAVLFNGRYYVYHGAVPAVLVFAPWRLITGWDLPQFFGQFLIISAGFLFWLGAVIRARGLSRTGVLIAMAVGLCSGAPYLLNRAEVYEVAVAGGFLCLGAGMYFLAGRQYALAGLWFGLAVGCRPHLGLVGLFGFVWLRMEHRPRAELLRYGATFAFALAALCLYNFARFGNPLEFGMRYMLSMDLRHQKMNFSWSHVVPGLYYYLWSPPEFQPVFPWIRTVMRFPASLKFLPGYYLEGMIGLLFFAPVSLLAIRATAGLARLAALSGAALLTFHIATGYTTPRYYPDFVPLLVFAAVVSCTGRIQNAVFAVLVLWGAVLNMQVALAGPWQDYLRNRPDSYLRLARIFSPNTRVRLVKNPPVNVTLQATPQDLPEGFQHPLFSMGRGVHRYLLYAEHRNGTLSIVSRSDTSTVRCAEGLPETAPVRVQITHDPPSQTMRIAVNDGPPVEHKTGLIITAPVQIETGTTDPFSYELTKSTFYGEITQIPR